MEQAVKIVVFLVDVPENKNMKNVAIDSAEFSMDVGKKSNWKLQCNLNGNIFLIRTRVNSVNSNQQTHSYQIATS